jgi:hypothetical protein
VGSQLSIWEVNEAGVSGVGDAETRTPAAEPPASLTFAGLEGEQLDRAWIAAGRLEPVPFNVIPF